MIYVTINFNYNSCLFHYRARYTHRDVHISIVHLTRLTDEKYRRRKIRKVEGAGRQKHRSNRKCLNWRRGREKCLADKTPEFIRRSPQGRTQSRAIHKKKSRHYIIIASIIRRNKRRRGGEAEHNAPIVTRQHEICGIVAIYHIDAPHESR